LGRRRRIETREHLGGIEDALGVGHDPHAERVELTVDHVLTVRGTREERILDRLRRTTASDVLPERPPLQRLALGSGREVLGVEDEPLRDHRLCLPASHPSQRLVLGDRSEALRPARVVDEGVHLVLLGGEEVLGHGLCEVGDEHTAQGHDPEGEQFQRA
jgi:hypothetical protein